MATRFGADGVQAHRLARGLGERGVSRRQTPAGTDRGTGLRPAAGPGRHRGLRGAGTGRAVPRQARRCRSGLHPAGHHRRHRAGCDAHPDLAVRRAADRGRHRRPVALAARRLAHRRPHRHRPGGDRGRGPGCHHPADAGTDRGDRRRPHPVRAVGVRRAGRPAGRVGLRPGAGPARSGIGAGAGPVRWSEPADRVTLVPWGDEKVSASNPADPWPGSLPAPSPARVRLAGLRSTEVAVLDDAGRPVLLTGRGLLTGSPAWLVHDGTPHRIDAWAGPWLLDERWWSADRRPAGARVQLVTDDGIAVLAAVDHPTAGRIEGVYD